MSLDTDGYMTVRNTKLMYETFNLIINYVRSFYMILIGIYTLYTVGGQYPYSLSQNICLQILIERLFLSMLCNLNGRCGKRAMRPPLQIYII